jgi:DNA polymerase II small subunit
LTQAREKEIIEYASQKDSMINSKALKILCDRTELDFKSLIDKLAEENQFIIDEIALERKIVKTKINTELETVVTHSAFKPIAKEYNSTFKELKEFNITNQSSSEGTVQDFTNLFKNKFEFLEKLLHNRQGFNPKPISRLREITRSREADFIGMVREKWKTKNGHLAFKFEDNEEECLALALKNKTQTLQQAEHVLLDDVVGVKASKGNGDIFFINEFIFPDVPLKEAKLCEEPINVALISDTHLGSKLFLEKYFQKFLEWINGDIESEKEKKLVGKIKYLVVAGDNVDGIGIYPNQINELIIKNIFEQYSAFEKLIEQIPDYIEIVIIPGQHDAVRWADPQPAIPKEFLPKLSQKNNVHLLSSPGWFEIEGLRCMLYHGAALHDLYESLSFLNASKPQIAMIEVLKRRTLMAPYGLKQPYVPEKKDFLLLREVPDLYFGGDMHHNGYDNYRGTTVMNSGTWQSQTDYQIKQGHVPTPGIVPILDLNNRQIFEKNFLKEF